MRVLKFEHRRQPLAPRSVLWRRMVASGTAAAVLIVISWLLGACGYHFVAGIHGWVDAFYNAAMILGGMGPVDTITGKAGKIFASFYALYSGFVLLTSAGIFLSPLMHRLVHRLHLEMKDS